MIIANVDENENTQARPAISFRLTEMTPKLIDTAEIKNLIINLMIETTDLFNLFIAFSFLLKPFGASPFEPAKARFNILTNIILT